MTPLHRLLIVIAACTFSGAACAKSPTAPLAPTGLAATWSGNASDSSGPGHMTWQIAQDASPFAGVLLITDTNGGYGGKGSVSGTVSGSALHVAMRIAAGGFEAPFEGCTAEMTGDAQFSTSTITGTYTGTSSCGGAISGGQFTLSRQ